jgi:transposase-like protein
MMGERGIGRAHTTILRWVQRYTPEFEKRWNRYSRAVGGSVLVQIPSYTRFGWSCLSI